MDSQSIIGVLVLIIFAVGSLTMIKRWLPALLTLPLMALAMVVVAALISRQISVRDISEGVIQGGALLLAKAIVTAFFGGMISFIMQKSGVAESLVKNGAELVGDNPFAVSVFCMGLIAMLFTTIGGLGAVIMISLVVLPMLATVGVQPVVAGGIMLFGLSMGGIVNPANWVFFQDTLKVPRQSVQSFALTTFSLMVVAGLLFITVELYRGGLVRSLTKVLTTIGVVAVAGGTGLFFLVRSQMRDGDGAAAAAQSAGVPMWMLVCRVAFAALFAWVLLLVLMDLRRRVRRWRHQTVTIKWYAYMIPVVPLGLILLFQLNELAAFLVGFAYAVLVTLRPGSSSLTIQSMIQGAATTLPAVMLMIGIGILIKSVQGPEGWSASHDGALWPVIAGIQPYFQHLPNTKLGYILIFGICAPLALYRGPLNTWGLGFGIATVLIYGAGFDAVAVMAMLMVVGQIQGVCDPTNTTNVWLANELRVDVQAFMKRTIVYVWAVAVVGLVIGAVLYV